MIKACVLTKTAEATLRLGALFSGVLETGDILSLDGDLGAGKTVFTKGIAEGLGIKDMISSPTFMLVMEHENPEGLDLFHFDAYRLRDADDFYAAGLDEYFDKEGVCVVEWGHLVKDAFCPFEEKTIIISITAENKRRNFTFFYQERKKEKMTFFLEKAKKEEKEMIEVLSC